MNMLDYATIVIVIATFATINELYGIATNLVLRPHLFVAESDLALPCMCRNSHATIPLTFYLFTLMVNNSIVLCIIMDYVKGTA